jgi:hypothetical protein
MSVLAAEAALAGIEKRVRGVQTLQELTVGVVKDTRSTLQNVGMTNRYLLMLGFNGTGEHRH